MVIKEISARIPNLFRRITNKDYYEKHKVDLFLAAFYLLSFYPILSSWYYGDDTVSRDIHAYINYENRSLISYILNQMNYYILKAGRFYPVHIWQRFLTFYFFDDINKYRFFIFSMNAIAIFSFSYMIKKYSDSSRLYYRIIVLYIGVFLFLTRYDDSITSYYMFIQMLVIYFSISLVLLKKYYICKQKCYLWFSVSVYLLSLLTYESSYMLVLIYPLAIYFLSQGTNIKRIRAAILQAIPYFCVTFICFITYIYFSANATSDYSGIHFSFNPLDIFITFIKQVIASFPVVPHAYLIFNSKGNFILDLGNTFNNISVTDIITGIIFLWLILKVFRSNRDEKEEISNKKFLIWLSILLIVFPSLIISVSLKYQQSLIWSLGYLTIYITRFGLLLLGLIIYDNTIPRVKNVYLRTFVNTLLVFLLVIVHLFSLQGNRNVLKYKNQTTYLRQIAEQAVKNGLLKDIPDDSIVLLGNTWYDYQSFSRNGIFSEWTKSNVRTDTINNFISTSFKNTGKDMTYEYTDLNVYYFHFNKYINNSGYAFSGKLESLSIDEKRITDITATNFKLFYNGSECEAIDILVKDQNNFVKRRFPLVSQGYGVYYISVPETVKLDSIELVKKVKPSLWQPEISYKSNINN